MTITPCTLCGYSEVTLLACPRCSCSRRVPPTVVLIGKVKMHDPPQSVLNQVSIYPWMSPFVVISVFGSFVKFIVIIILIPILVVQFVGPPVDHILAIPAILSASTYEREFRRPTQDEMFCDRAVVGDADAHAVVLGDAILTGAV